MHQGNGTAALLSGNKNVFTFSVHGAHNYPFHKEKSTLDIGLPDGISGKKYLEILQEHLPKIIDTFRPTRLFYLSGVDVLSTDKFGKMALTRTECADRDRYIFETARCHSLPVAVAMGGGYSPEIKDIVEAHCNTFRLAVDVFGL